MWPFKKKFKHIDDEKEIELFALVHRNSQKDFITIANNRKDILEHAAGIYKLKHAEHYKLWCEYRHFDIKSPIAWAQYFNDCIGEEEKKEYLIKPIHYKFKDIVAIMRMFGGCIPLGSSFNTPLEVSFFNTEYGLAAKKEWEESDND